MVIGQVNEIVATISAVMEGTDDQCQGNREQRLSDIYRYRRNQLKCGPASNDIRKVFLQMVDILTTLFAAKTIKSTYKELEQRVQALEKEVTDLEQIKEALGESENIFRKIYENTSQAIILSTFDGKFLSCNNAFGKMLGYTQAEFKNISAKDIYINPDDRLLLIKHVRAKGPVHDVKITLKRKDGTRCYVQVNATPFIYNKNVVLLTSYKDISEELQAKMILQTIIDESPIGISIYDSTGQCIAANNSLGSIIGTTKEQVLEQNWHNIESWKKCGLYAKAQRAIEANCKERLEITTESSFGKMVSLRCHLVPYHREDETHLLLMVDDITERRKADEKRRHLESQLLQSQKMEAIGTLSGGIAHDFNNILLPVLGYTEMTIAELPENSPARKNLTNVLKMVNRAKELVQQILTFSRQTRYEKRPVKVQSIVMEALKLLRASIPKTIEFRQNIDDSCGPILADSIQIHQIIMNLSTNAYHAMEHNGGCITINLTKVHIGSDDQKLLPALNPGDHVLLSVNDTGQGMDPETMENIFVPYFTTKEHEKGTGLGLSIVHGIVKSCGGDIKVYSEPGKGSTFNVYLPQIEIRNNKPETTPSTQLSKGTERILIVDDELDIVKVEQQMLEHLGYNVTGRTSSIEAWEAFRVNPESFDLVIADMTMPNMTGLQLSRELVQIRPNIPIILCTGFSEMLTEETIAQAGIAATLMKPITMKKMADTIRQVLDKGLGSDKFHKIERCWPQSLVS